MAKRRDYLLEIRERAAGNIYLYTNGVVVRLNDFYTDVQYAEITHEAMLTAALANKPVPVKVEGS